AEITRYELQSEGVPSRLVLLDTVGYGHTGPKPDQLRATEEAARQSDLLLLVLHATNPARQADLQLLEALKAWFAGQPHLNLPPTVAVSPHTALLPPKREWSPPSDLKPPRRTKEQQIDQAAATVREQLGPYLVGVVPVRSDEGKVYGIEEYFLPVLADLLDQA